MAAEAFFDVYVIEVKSADWSENGRPETKRPREGGASG
jgi:hypothetical protein